MAKVFVDFTNEQHIKQFDSFGYEGGSSQEHINGGYKSIVYDSETGQILTVTLNTGEVLGEKVDPKDTTQVTDFRPK